ncbi:oxygen-dependent choline dehydrogenase [Cladorrhinum sp. PSN332]|nr:oxygen-dependent choline dehydrogenase [Cladorrhinum sp. PSN332]
MYGSCIRRVQKVPSLRLSENPDLKVLVLEAGSDHANDIKVITPGIFGSLYGNLTYHWEHRVAPQRGLNNRSHAIMSGKGWSWDELQPYYQKSETFVKPSAAQMADLNLTFIDPSAHGYDGSIVNSFPSTYESLLEAWPRTFANLGLGADGDPRGGQASGGFINPFNINPVSKERSYSGSTYNLLASTRSNLKVITGALVTKVDLESKRGVPTATGVIYQKNGLQHKAHTKREVIVSLGGLASPKLLELSGIGDHKLLKSMGIKTVVNNPNVGENQYTTTRTGPFTTVNASSVLLTLNQLGIAPSHLEPLLVSPTKQQSLLFSSLTSPKAPPPAAQILLISGGMSPWYFNSTSLGYSSPRNGAGKKHITLLALLQHPFSRGSDLTHPLDIQISKAATLQLQNIASTRPLSDHLLGNGTAFQPGCYKLDEKNVESFIREFTLLASHYSGTCAMQPRRSQGGGGPGGVVDERFRVYGTKGLRVVDASIFPLIPQATLNNVVIAVAEKAADMIRGEYGL